MRSGVAALVWLVPPLHGDFSLGQLYVFGCLSGWLVGWLVGCMVGWLVGWFFGGLIGG